METTKEGSPPKILLLGGTGGVGRWILWYLFTNNNMHTAKVNSNKQQPLRYLAFLPNLKLQTYKVRLLIRNEEKAKKLFESLGFGPLISSNQALMEYYVGEINDRQAVNRAMMNVEYVISVIGPRYPSDSMPAVTQTQIRIQQQLTEPPVGLVQKVIEDGMQSIVKAASALGPDKIRHIIMLSSCFVLRPSHASHKLQNMFQENIMIWRLKAENLLRKSGLRYTIIRPGNMEGEPYPSSPEVFRLEREREGPILPRRYLIDQGDQVVGDISRKDVALLCLLALQHSDQTANTTFEAVLQPVDEQPQEEEEKKEAEKENLDQSCNNSDAGSEMTFGEMFQRLVKETQPMPDWELDNDVTNCKRCNAGFWLFNQRHHCRKCGGIFCGDCANQFEPIPQYGLLNAVRVCRFCSVRKESAEEL